MSKAPGESLPHLSASEIREMWSGLSACADLYRELDLTDGMYEAMAE